MVGAGHRGERMKSNTGRARDSASDRTLVSRRQRPALPENTYLATPRSHQARGAGQRHESACGHAEAERSTSFSKSRSRSLSSSSASTVEIADNRHSPSQGHQSPSTKKTKEKKICHRLINNVGGCKFGENCRYRHDTLPAPQEKPEKEPREESREVTQKETPEVDLAHYTSWGPNGMQGGLITLQFFPQGSSSIQPQPQRLQGVAPSMNTDHLPTPRNQNQRAHEVASSIDLTQSPPTSGLGKIGANEKGENPAPSLRQQQQQRRDKPRDGPKKHADRQESNKEQRCRQHRAKSPIGRNSDQQERHRRSRGEALASSSVRDDTAHKRSVSCSSSEDPYSVSSCEDRDDKRSRAREAVRSKRTSHSPDALEERIVKATAAVVEKWRRELEQTAKLEAEEDKSDEGRAANPPNSPPSTTKMVYSPVQPSKSHAHNKNPGSKGENSRGQSHMPKGQQNQRPEQRFLNRGQQPRRGFPPPGQQRKQSSSSGQQPRGRGGARTTPTPASIQRHVSSPSPDAFEEEIATAAAAEEKNWAREQAQTAKGKAKPTRVVNRARQAYGPSSRGNQSTRVSGRARTKREKSPNLIDI
ncbi:hypothetical protein F4679DRAFT_324121 [Xylaria curta]|nr:hypothetical protein F4679DRAFT_324121 [Xylaria curta]